MADPLSDLDDLLTPPGLESTRAERARGSRITFGGSQAWGPEPLAGELAQPVWSSKAAEVARTIGIGIRWQGDASPGSGVPGDGGAQGDSAEDSVLQSLLQFRQFMGVVEAAEARDQAPELLPEPREEVVSATPGGSPDSEDAQLRERFTAELLEDLKLLEGSVGTYEAMHPANRLLHNLRDLRDLLPCDPYVEVAMALYDGLVFEDRWAELEAEQYEGLSAVFSRLVRDRELDDDEVANAIMAIERLGVDTTPYPFVAEAHQGD